jgi:hypothetical protein
VTEGEWRTTSDVNAMLRLPSRRRKLRVYTPERFYAFAAACRRRVRPFLGEPVEDVADLLETRPSGSAPPEVIRAWELYDSETSRLSQLVGALWLDVLRGVAVAPRPLAELWLQLTALQTLGSVRLIHPFTAAWKAAQDSLHTIGRVERLAAVPDDLTSSAGRIEMGCETEPVAEGAIQADLLRCVFGNPFRPVSFDPAWRTEAVVGLARGMDDAHDFAALPVLADALEDAGCADAGLLAHARGPGPHARGCHVIDHVLGRW